MDNVFLYRNLTRKCFSLRHKGRVFLRSTYALMKNCHLKVSQAGRERVLQTGKKNVHAGIQGELIPQNDIDVTGWTKLRYNPKYLSSFIRTDTGMPVTRADLVACFYPNIYALNPR